MLSIIKPKGPIFRSGSAPREVEREYPFFMLLLSCLYTSDLGSRDLPSIISGMKHVLGPISDPFSRLRLLINVWSYSQIRAIELVSRALRDGSLKGFMIRWAEAIGVGLGMPIFMKIEYERFMVSYRDWYERTMERMKRLSEAYIAITTSVTVIAISMIMITLIYSVISIEFLLTTVASIIIATVTAISFVVWRSVPHGEVVARRPMRIGRVGRIEDLSRRLYPAIIAVTAITIALFIEGFDLWYISPPFSFIILGSSALLIGMRGKIEIGRIKAMDEFAPVFVKTLGDSLGVSGSMKGALRIIVNNDYGPLTAPIRRLYRRACLDLDIRKCWMAFEREVSSGLIYRACEIMLCSLRAGSKPTAVALEIYRFLSILLELRKRREQVSGYLKGMLLPLQGTFVAVFAVMNSLIANLAILGESARAYMNVLAIGDTRALTAFIFIVMLILSSSGSLNIGSVEGDSPVTRLYFLGMLMVLSGGVFFAVDTLTSGMFRLFGGLDLIEVV